MSFRRYATERIVASAVVLAMAVTFVFVVFYLLPGDPAKSVAGKGASPAAVERVRHDLHLDRPVHEQYREFVARLVVHGSLGHSYYNSVSVGAIVGEAAPVTGSLVVWALVFALAFGVPAGLLWAGAGRAVGGLVRLFVCASPGLFIAVWWGLLFAYFLGYRLHVFPITGYADFFDPPPGQPGGPLQWAYHMILPGLSLGIPIGAVYALIVRGLVWDVRAAEAEDRDAARRSAVTRFTRRIVLDLSWLFGATILVEIIFSCPGLGRTAIQAINNYDGPTIEGVLLSVAIVQIGIYLVGSLAGALVSKEWRTL